MTMSNTTTLDVVSVATAHAWVKDPCSCQWSGVECTACQLDLATCSACGMGSEVCTTQCSGKKVGRLLESVVYRAGLDFVNGAWAWQPEETVTMTHSGAVVVSRPAGSIDRLVAYAERRVAKVGAARWIARRSRA
jgi:hypothetical protein